MVTINTVKANLFSYSFVFCRMFLLLDLILYHMVTYETLITVQSTLSRDMDTYVAISKDLNVKLLTRQTPAVLIATNQITATEYQ